MFVWTTWDMSGEKYHQLHWLSNFYVCCKTHKAHHPNHFTLHNGGNSLWPTDHPFPLFVPEKSFWVVYLHWTGLLLHCFLSVSKGNPLDWTSSIPNFTQNYSLHVNCLYLVKVFRHYPLHLGARSSRYTYPAIIC